MDKLKAEEIMAFIEDVVSEKYGELMDEIEKIEKVISEVEEIKAAIKGIEKELKTIKETEEKMKNDESDDVDFKDIDELIDKTIEDLKTILKSF